MFSYQHVVITGGGTGLGKTLVQGIFTRGAIVTMVGKDEHKLEQLARELDVSHHSLLSILNNIPYHMSLFTSTARTLIDPADQLRSRGPVRAQLPRGGARHQSD